MSFEKFPFDRRIVTGIQAAGYITPTPIQDQAIPLVLEGRDVLGIAQTGTGKTAAFILPILQRLLRERSRHVRALILAPTRELAEQIHQTAVELGRETGGAARQAEDACSRPRRWRRCAAGRRSWLPVRGGFSITWAKGRSIYRV